MITVHTPGERLEIDVFDDRHIEHSFFRGDESVESDEQALAQHLWELARADLEE